MKVILFGYGKMGQLIEKFVQKRGHQVVYIIDENNRSTLKVEDLPDYDIAIDFSTPQGTLDNIHFCLDHNIPLVIGTTGWYEQLEEIEKKCLDNNQSLLWGSNFSIGVNIFFHINKVLAKVMGPYKQYDVQVEEIHHTQKLDAPSGTAISIAEGILENLDSKKQWVNHLVDMEDNVIPKKEDLLIESLRIDDVPGTHTVLYSSEVDQLEFKHTAHSRDGFALGAVIAAEWLLGKKGFYSVTDIFDFNN